MVTGTNLDVVQEPRIRVKYAGQESVNVRTTMLHRACAVTSPPSTCTCWIMCADDSPTP